MKIQCDKCGKIFSDVDIYLLNIGWCYGHISRKFICKKCYKEETKESIGEQVISNILHPQRLMN